MLIYKYYGISAFFDLYIKSGENKKIYICHLISDNIIICLDKSKICKKKL